MEKTLPHDSKLYKVFVNFMQYICSVIACDTRFSFSSLANEPYKTGYPKKKELESHEIMKKY